MILLTILIFIVILGLLVFVHELGHFVMAKRAGMRVDEFGFGFPPRLFGIKRGETIYSINWIPLGGFVKIAGEDGGEGDSDPRNFANKSFWQRFLVLIAGVSMNVVLAWLLISLGLGLGLPTVIEQGQQISPNAKITQISTATILLVAADSPANQAGLKVGDSIVKIAETEVKSIEQAQDLTKQYSGQPTKYTFKRGSDTFERELVPRANPPENQGPLGVNLGSVGRVSYPWYEAIYRGVGATIAITLATLSAFGEVIRGWFTGGGPGVELSGPVGIAVLTRDVAQLGFIYLLQFTAVLSVNLAIINALPFPALDGGRILFLIVEKIRGKKMRASAEQIANTLGFALLILLMVFVTVKDVGRFNIVDKVKDLF